MVDYAKMPYWEVCSLCKDSIWFYSYDTDMFIHTLMQSCFYVVQELNCITEIHMCIKDNYYTINIEWVTVLKAKVVVKHTKENNTGFR